jgi:hypothetical protein
MPAPESKRRWFRLSPDRFVAGLLLVIGLIWLSDRFQWFGFNHHKGWTVLIAVAAVGVSALVMLLWWAGALTFGWRFQFGIRSLLVFFLASSIAVSWLAVEMQRARRQKETVEWVEDLGGWVDYDWQTDADGEYIDNPEPPRPGQLQKILGDDFFSDVTCVGFCHDAKFTDAGLKPLWGMTQLRLLVLVPRRMMRPLPLLKEGLGTGHFITNAELEHLNENLPHLLISSL